MEERYRLSQQRMLALAGQEEMLRKRKAKSRYGEAGIYGGVRQAGLGAIESDVGAQRLTRARELESQRLTEEQKWLGEEMGHRRQLGLMEAGYGHQGRLAREGREWQAGESALQRQWQTGERTGGEEWKSGERMGTEQFQATQADLNRQLQDELTRGGWTEEAGRLRRQIMSNERMQQEQLGFGREQLGFQYEQLAEQMGLDRDKLALQETLTREGWTQEAQQLQMEIDAKERQVEQQLGWEREKMYGPEYAGAGGGGPFGGAGGALGRPYDDTQYGGTYGLAQQQLGLDYARLAQQGEQFGQTLGWEQQKFGEAYQQQRGLMDLQNTYQLAMFDKQFQGDAIQSINSLGAEIGMAWSKGESGEGTMQRFQDYFGYLGQWAGQGYTAFNWMGTQGTQATGDSLPPGVGPGTNNWGNAGYYNYYWGQPGGYDPGRYGF
jgi:hypothetical protein